MVYNCTQLNCSAMLSSIFIVVRVIKSDYTLSEFVDCTAFLLRRSVRILCVAVWNKAQQTSHRASLQGPATWRHWPSACMGDQTGPELSRPLDHFQLTFYLIPLFPSFKLWTKLSLAWFDCKNSFGHRELADLHQAPWLGFTGGAGAESERNGYKMGGEGRGVVNVSVPPPNPRETHWDMMSVVDKLFILDHLPQQF